MEVLTFDWLFGRIQKKIMTTDAQSTIVNQPEIDCKGVYLYCMYNHVHIYLGRVRSLSASSYCFSRAKMLCDCAANFRQFYLLLWKNFILQVSLNSVRGDSLLLKRHQVCAVHVYYSIYGTYSVQVDFLLLFVVFFIDTATNRNRV